MTELTEAVFTRTGPLMEATSYPVWAQQLLRDCSIAKQRVVNHEFYQKLRDNTLTATTMRQYLVGGWPVVEQFALYMAQNLTKTRYGRSPGEDMARRWLMRNIRVELNHADYWVHWAQAHGVTVEDLHAQKVPPELTALSHWCWHSSASDTLVIGMAATNYAIEGATGEWAHVVCSSDTYANAFPEAGRKRAMRWLALHAEYDDAHPWEALEIICTLAGPNPSRSLQAELRKAICKSYDYMYLFLERCMELERMTLAAHADAGEAMPA
ncbi:TenA family transcriptional regulator [Pseudomonas typographi]|uniref:TenA family transcriptional regulator n=1 Tax=Pseudomonas typographi TaxID=2715964 RepID=A0ABR7Z074_9PSED|nr:iron-containing redox enzyme family protein [Pseudomonas typographi]MBD1586455.1 TenA family transcriptional regulator [Pseudomonas typographi]MBD1598833.1 TenA family transcriptional regulator [Pseudomonas typographi]